MNLKKHIKINVYTPLHHGGVLLDVFYVNQCASTIKSLFLSCVVIWHRVCDVLFFHG